MSSTICFIGFCEAETIFKSDNPFKKYKIAIGTTTVRNYYYHKQLLLRRAAWCHACRLDLPGRSVKTSLEPRYER